LQEVHRAVPQEVKYEVVGRLKPGVSLESAEWHMRDIVDSASPDLAWFSETESVRVESMVDYVVGSARNPLLLLCGLAVALLIVSAVNLATLVVLIADQRRHDRAIQVALGATPRAIVCGALLQIGIIVLSAAVIGVVLSFPLLAVLEALLSGSLARVEELRAFDLTVPFGVTLLLAIAVVVGFIPAFRIKPQAIRADLSACVGSTPIPSVHRGRRMLLCLHVSLLFGLMVAATLIVISLWRAQTADLGFDSTDIYVTETRLLDPRYPAKDMRARQRFRQDVLERVRHAPGVTGAATSSAMPFRGTDWLWIVRTPNSSARVAANGRQVDPVFFQMLNIRLVAGRLFTKNDDPSAQQVAIVSRSLASRLFGSEPVLGKIVVASGQQRTIVGVVEDLRYVARWDPPRPAIYVPVEQQESEIVCLAVKSQLPAARIESIVHEAVTRVDPLQPIEGPAKLRDIVAISMAEREFVMLANVAFALTALVLAIVGVHGGVSQRIADRQAELGIRAALGARARNLRWLVARGELAPLVLGIVLGGAVSYVVARFMDATAYGVNPTSLRIYAATAAFLLATGVIALMASTWKLKRIDIVKVLRS
jgi:predicted permease